MLENDIKIAFRNFRKNKLFSLLNIIGLAIGIVGTREFEVGSRDRNEF